MSVVGEESSRQVIPGRFEEGFFALRARGKSFANDQDCKLGDKG